jgi:opacity protein-like surface antigen
MDILRQTMAAAAVAGVALCASTASADDAAQGGFFSKMYVDTDLGVSFVPNVSVKDTALSPTVDFGTAGVSADIDAGFAWNIALGVEVSESASIELQTGYTRNGFGGFTSGQWVAFGVAGGLPIGGGDGDLTQIPVFVNAKYEIPLMERTAGSDGGGLKLELGGGLGVVNVGADIDDIEAVGLGVLLPGAGGARASIDGSSWEFAGQLMVGLAWELSSNIDLGVRYRFVAVSGADLGVAQFNTPLLTGVGSVETDSVYSHSISAMLSIEF